MSGGPGDIKFDLNDFRQQVVQIKDLGSLRDILRKIPGLGALLGGPGALDIDLGVEIGRIQGIIDSMTPQERANPALIDGGRRRRIAAGAGVYPAEVASLLKQFEAMAAMVKQMAAMAMLDKIRALTGLGQLGTPTPGYRPSASKPDTSGRGSPGVRRTRVEEGSASVEVRRLRVERPLSPPERETLRRLWEILARNGRTPAGEEPWFSNWNRNLRLWDLVADE